MRPIYSLIPLFFIVASIAPATSSPEPIKQLSGAINLGNASISVSTQGTVQIDTPTGRLIVNTDSATARQNGPTDIYIDPKLVNGMGTPVFGQNRPLHPLDPTYGIAQSSLLNHLSAYFSTASGGFGFRLSFDRRISPRLRAIVTPEFLTYSFLRAQEILGIQMPDNTTRVTLFSFPVGLQHQISPNNRVVPHFGFGVGPMVRFDHRPAQPGYRSAHGGFRTNGQLGQDAIGLSIPILVEDYPDMSLTLGGHIAAGFAVKLDKKKEFGLSIEGRYTLANFVDELGAPGNFSGFSLGIGFGKHF